jgi:hypothetical protein
MSRSYISSPPKRLHGVQRDCLRVSKYTDFFKGESLPDDGGSTHLWNAVLRQRDYTVLYSKRLIFILAAVKK